MISLMVTFRTFSFFDFPADLLQKSISVASNLFACCVFSAHVSAPHRLVQYFGLKPGTYVFWFREGYFFLHKTEFNMPTTLFPTLVLFSISKAVAPVASRMDPRYLNLLTALICPVSV
jgi:hypothetical protein